MSLLCCFEHDESQFTIKQKSYGSCSNISNSSSNNKLPEIIEYNDMEIMIEDGFVIKRIFSLETKVNIINPSNDLLEELCQFKTNYWNEIIKEICDKPEISLAYAIRNRNWNNSDNETNRILTVIIDLDKVDLFVSEMENRKAECILKSDFTNGLQINDSYVNKLPMNKYNRSLTPSVELFKKLGAYRFLPSPKKFRNIYTFNVSRNVISNLLLSDNSQFSIPYEFQIKFDNNNFLFNNPSELFSFVKLHAIESSQDLMIEQSDNENINTQETNENNQTKKIIINDSICPSLLVYSYNDYKSIVVISGGLPFLRSKVNALVSCMLKCKIITLHESFSINKDLLLLFNFDPLVKVTLKNNKLLVNGVNPDRTNNVIMKINNYFDPLRITLFETKLLGFKNLKFSSIFKRNDYKILEKCCICSQLESDINEGLITLRCQHTYCRECLKKHILQEEYYTKCIVCKSLIQAKYIHLLSFNERNKRIKKSLDYFISINQWKYVYCPTENCGTIHYRSITLLICKKCGIYYCLTCKISYFAINNQTKTHVGHYCFDIKK